MINKNAERSPGAWKNRSTSMTTRLIETSGMDMRAPPDTT